MALWKMAAAGKANRERGTNRGFLEVTLPPWIEGKEWRWGVAGAVQCHSVLTNPERPVDGCIHPSEGQEVGVVSIYIIITSLR